MADYCRQCNLEIFNSKGSDFSNIAAPDEYAHVVCEGCGPIWVDCLGTKVEPEA